MASRDAWSEFRVWFRQQNPTARLVIMAVVLTMAGTLAFVAFPDFGATTVLAYVGYALGAGIELVALRRDGPFVRSGSVALRKEGAFVMLLVVILIVPVLVSVAVGLPALYDAIRGAMRGAGFAFIASLTMCSITAVQAHYLYQ